MSLGDFKRWMYRGQRPNWIARTLNRAWAAVGSSGVASNYLVTLEVIGRTSGRTISLLVVFAVVEGQRYLVSMLGDNVRWVQNVRAARGRCTFSSSFCSFRLIILGRFRAQTPSKKGVATIWAFW